MIRNNLMPMMGHKSNDPPPEKANPPPTEEGERVIESADLLRGTDQVVIRHEGRLYRLRRTRLGKLILTA